MAADHVKLKGVEKVGDGLLSDFLEVNCSAFFNHALLEAGGFANVEIPASGAYGGHYHRLRPVQSPNYSNGQLWEGARQEWVWETGLDYKPAPIRVSGVYVNGGFHPATGLGPYSHHVNYPLGQVLFDSPISPTSLVTCEYSFRWAPFKTADEPWWQEIQFDSHRVDDAHFLQSGSGAWATLGQNRVQLPCVIVEAAPNARRIRGFEVGNETAIVQQDVLCHVLAEQRWDKKQLHDILTYQWPKRLWGFDKNRMMEDGAMPLDEYGSPTGSGKNYADWVKPTGEGGYVWRQLRIVDTRATDQRGVSPLYYCTVRLILEVDLP